MLPASPPSRRSRTTTGFGFTTSTDEHGPRAIPHSVSTVITTTTEGNAWNAARTISIIVAKSLKMGSERPTNCNSAVKVASAAPLSRIAGAVAEGLDHTGAEKLLHGHGGLSGASELAVDMASVAPLLLLDATRIDSGDHVASTSWYRVSVRDRTQMPPQSTEVVDQAGSDSL
ncbi:MAG: hypothetical protein ACPHRO_00575 [Nannocystaceae bacterium]